MSPSHHRPHQFLHLILPHLEALLWYYFLGWTAVTSYFWMLLLLDWRLSLVENWFLPFPHFHALEAHSSLLYERWQTLGVFWSLYKSVELGGWQLHRCCKVAPCSLRIILLGLLVASFIVNCYFCNCTFNYLVSFLYCIVYISIHCPWWKLWSFVQLD